jgi:hypothetical protein
LGSLNFLGDLFGFSTMAITLQGHVVRDH